MCTKCKEPFQLVHAGCLLCNYVCRDADSFYYWATVDIPSAGSQHGGDDSFLSVGSMQQNVPDAPPWAGRQMRGDSETHSHSSGPHTGTNRDWSSFTKLYSRLSMKQQLGSLQLTIQLLQMHHMLAWFDTMS